MRKRKSSGTRNKMNFSGVREVALALPVIILSAFFLGNYCSAAITRAAVFSAGVILPQGTVGAIRSNISMTADDPAAVNSGNDFAAVTSVDSAVPDAGTSSPDTEIPEDILAMIQQAQAKSDPAQRAGSIVEKQYDVSSATSSFENITVRNTTPSHSINIEASYKQPASLSIQDKTQPTVLIFHTHTTECYEILDNGWYSSDYITRSNDPAQNMVRVGAAICAELEKAGIGYVHDTEIHDTAYTGAYDRSREAILKILKENPSIQIVLDVHRDAIQQNDGTRIKPTAVIRNRKAAQIMIIAGCEDGKVTSFPSWEQNLTFALQLHKTAESANPGLMRPILFSARKYNMDVVPCSVLLEFGSDSNTLAEAVYSGQLMGKAIAEFVNANAP